MDLDAATAATSASASASASAFHGRQTGRDDGMVHWVLVSSEHLVVKVVVKVVVVWWSGRLVRHRHRHRTGTGGTRRAGMAAAWDATRALRPLRLGAWGPRRCEDE
jgi:hypothetical protein